MFNPDMSVWTGRDDTATEGPRALRWHQCVKPLTEGAEPGVVLIGFACDEGVRRNGGRLGAKDGPRAMRKVLANLAWHQEHPVYDAGDVSCAREDLEGAQDQLAGRVAEVLRDRQRPLVLGGGHETAWGTYQGLFRACPESSIGVINIDAHFDLRTSERGHSGTPFAQVAEKCRESSRPFRYFCWGISPDSNTAALFDRAKQLGVAWVTDTTVGDTYERLREFMAGVDEIHVSIDLDVLPGSVMPAVSSPAGRGISLEQVESVIGVILDSRQVAAVDVVEFNPSFDRDGQGARVAARIVRQVASEWES